jgi:hypothetical protein
MAGSLAIGGAGSGVEEADGMVGRVNDDPEIFWSDLPNDERRFQWKGERLSLNVTDFLRGGGVYSEGITGAEAKLVRRSQVIGGPVLLTCPDRRSSVDAEGVEGGAGGRGKLLPTGLICLGERKMLLLKRAKNGLAQGTVARMMETWSTWSVVS